ncbi:MAG: FtsQ-type POTRA domain-containing protein [Acidobacteriota bacterium]
MSPHRAALLGFDPHLRRGVDASATSAHRMRRPAVRRRRISRWRRALMWTAGLAAAAAIGYGLWTAPQLRLDEIVIVPPRTAAISDGASADDAVRRVADDWVHQQLAFARGSALVTLDLAYAASALRGHPWVADVGLRKVPPNQLEVTIYERRPVALQQRVGPDGAAADAASPTLSFVDADGRVIAPFDPRRGAVDLPLVRLTPNALRRPHDGELPRALVRQRAVADALDVRAALARTRPAWHARLSEIVVLGGGDHRLVVQGMPFPLIVRADTLDTTLPPLERLLPHLLDRFGALRAVDVRFPHRLIVQPVNRSADGSRT